MELSNGGKETSEYTRIFYSLFVNVGAVLRGLSFLSGLVVFCFALSFIAPGDTARSVLGPNARETDVAQLRHDMGWDLPLTSQLMRYLNGLAHLDLGRSSLTGRNVLDEIIMHFRYTVAIGGTAALSSMFIALSINWLLLIHPVLVPIIPLLRVGVSAPSFLIALFAALFSGSLLVSLGLDKLDSSSFSLWTLLWTSSVIAVYPAALMTTLLRDRCVSIRHGPYCRAATAYGYSPSWVFWRVILPNAAGIMIAAWINQISVMVFSTILVEQFFSIPGGGALLIRSIQAKDLSVISGVVLLNGIFFLIINSLGMRFADWLAQVRGMATRVSSL